MLYYFYQFTSFGGYMGNRVFNKDIPHKCKYCIRSHSFGSADEVLCSKRGAVFKDDCCRKYIYDATKRIPEKSSLGHEYSEEDFEL